MRVFRSVYSYIDVHYGKIADFDFEIALLQGLSLTKWTPLPPTLA
jgi:hypothetical protein